MFGKSPIGVFFRLSEMLWKFLPTGATRLGPLRAYGSGLHAIARMRLNRTFYFGTFFLRNRPQLALAGRVAEQVNHESGLRIAILGCSIGAEVYSILWAIRLKRPDLKIVTIASDISREALEFAEKGVYPLEGCELTDEKIFARVTEQEKLELFHSEAAGMRVKAWLKEGIRWRIADVADPDLVHALGQQDIVFANNLLCHMVPGDAEKCLRNIAKLARPGGYLFVSGVDLDVRAKVARELKLEPVTDLIEDIHNGDPALIKDWPFRYWGLEPFDKRRPDWKFRYASVFRVTE
ncbi:MAG TPA: CheR family methyltransferase [Acetobacteraceae bacterium]|nr:CheR family methyltransferase [Acetobacteraceae bacterium]